MKRTLKCIILIMMVALVACAPSPAETAPPATGAEAGEAAPPAEPTEQPEAPPAGEAAPAGPVPAPDESGCTRYAAPDGDDANPGTADAPWWSLQHAADSAQPGDVVCFRGGTYTAGEAIITTSGSEGAPITFMAYPGETAVLDGQGEAGGIITLKQGASHLRFSGLVVTGYTVWGVSLEGDNRDVVLDHLNVSGGEAGIHFTVGYSGEDPWYGPVEYVTVEDTAVSGTMYTAIDCTPGPCNNMVFRRLEVSNAGLVGEASFGADALAVERGHDILVEDSLIHDNGGDGIDLNSRDWDGNVPGIVVRRNQVFRNHLQAIKLWGGGRMENNAVWGQGINPVVIGVYPGEFVVANNTIAYNMWDPAYSARDYSFVAAWPETGESAAITLTLVNNIFAFNSDPLDGGPTGIYLGTGVTLVNSGGNIFFSREDSEIQADFVTTRDPSFTQADILSGAWAAVSGSQGDTVIDPLLAGGWPNVDLRPAAGSPAIDAGLPGNAPADDVTGQPRDGRPDIGAYEYRP